jgi:hypothetical protein
MRTVTVATTDILAPFKAACERRGCHLEDQFNVEKLRYEFVHWKHGAETDDHHLTLAVPDAEIVRVWLGNVHR